MNTLMKLIMLSFLVSSLVSCEDNYQQDIEQWQSERLNELQAPYAWPSVIGLYTMLRDTVSFGSAADNDLIVEGGAPAIMGQIRYQDDQYVLKMEDGLNARIDDVDINSEIKLLTDKEENGPTTISWQSYQWHLIERGEETYLRMKDTLSEYRSKLLSIPNFPISQKWNIPAEFIPADSSDRIVYDNILDMTFNHAFAGYLNFEIDGTSYQLKAMENDVDSYFVIISDQTTGLETYDGGRYLYTKKADRNGQTHIDFNKAVNPPCVFTPYATCPLPPADNHIDVKVEAGEQKMTLYKYK